MPKQGHRSRVAPRRRKPRACIVQVSVRGGPHRGTDREVMRRRATKMLDHLGLSNVELSIALVDDATIHDLNHRYRRRDRPTDVLSFSMTEGEPAPTVAGAAELLGDVVISVPTARRQARKRRRPLLDELTTLLAHGLLHLLGHDHRTRAQHRAMEAERVELEGAACARRTR